MNSKDPATTSSAATLGELCNEAAHRFGARRSLGFNGAWETFAETRAKVDQFARGLIALGVGPGDKVSLWMTNRPEWLHAMYAVAKIGAVLVPLNTRFRTADLDYILRQSDTSTLITMDRSGPIEYLEMTGELCPELHTQSKGALRCEAFPELRRVICLGENLPQGVHSWGDVMAAAEAIDPAALARREDAVRPSDTQFIMYTSGTTGFPKGVMQNHSVLRNARHTLTRMAMTGDDITLMFLPLFHAFGYFEGALLTFVAGAPMALMDVFDAGEALRQIESERATILHGFDTHWQDLAEHPDRPMRDLSSLRTGICAVGLPSSVPAAEMANRFICPTLTGYGMTEIMPGALLGKFGDTREHSTATSGEPSEGYEFKIIDAATGDALGDGVPGEICVRGYAVMQGYYKKPDETAKSIDPDGWFHTGDMGVRNPDGYYRFLGRYKEMLKVGGENVDPAEVEAYFLAHPAVARIQIVGVADHRLSEIPVAFVVLERGAAATAKELDAHARGKLASFKLPKHYFFIDELPMTSSGKVKRFELREDARARLGIAEPSIEKG